MKGSAVSQLSRRVKKDIEDHKGITRMLDAIKKELPVEC